MSFGKVLRRVLTVDEWNIGVADLDLEELVRTQGGAAPEAVRPPVRWFRKPWYVRFWADPCLLDHEGRRFLYYEQVLLGMEKGRLRCVELTMDGTPAGASRSMIQFDHHAAYPFVLEHSGSFYCVPEIASSGTVALYGSDSPLGPWTRQCAILEGAGAVDSTLFPFGGRFWLFYTSNKANERPGGHVDNLYIWHAPDIGGPWQPHPIQPAILDIRSSRPAGRPFIVDGVLYRPAQDCSTRYGGRTVINRVKTLTPDDFQEEVCAYLEPDARGPYPDGLHTLTAVGNLAIIDGFRERPSFNPVKVVATNVRKGIRNIRRRRRLRKGTLASGST
jgi:hypothetical protein